MFEENINTNKSSFQDFKVIRLHEILLKYMVFIKYFCSWDSLGKMQAMKTGSLLIQTPSDLNCLDERDRGICLISCVSIETYE